MQRFLVEGLPRTNNDLEQAFSVLQHHQRRCTGRKVAASSIVIRGTVQLASAIEESTSLFYSPGFGSLLRSKLATITPLFLLHSLVFSRQFT
ncbi:transposase [Nostoc carneum NIES-2107]|nr:transposase [Nostoc carneum NIES-2107]